MEMYRVHETEGVAMNRIAQILHRRDVRDQNGKGVDLAELQRAVEHEEDPQGHPVRRRNAGRRKATVRDQRMGRDAHTG